MWSSLSLLYSRSTLGFGSLGGHTQKNHTRTQLHTVVYTLQLDQTAQQHFSPDEKFLYNSAFKQSE